MAQILTALICLNAHPINWRTEDRPTFNTKFCKQCGAKTINACPQCNSPIQGTVIANSGHNYDPRTAPAYCHECGSPYPCTAERMKAAKDIVELSTTLGAEDKAEVIDAIILTSTESPRTPVAAEKLKKYLPVIGKTAQDVITAVLSETAKNILFPGP